MYLNAFLVADLAESLRTKLKGARLIGAFSTGKNELYLLFSCPFALRIQFFKGEAFFQEVPFDHIQKVNRLPIFKEALELKITDVYAYPFDRVLRMDFENGHQLVFYLFGKFSQLSLYEHNELISHFPGKSKWIEKLEEPEPFQLSDLANWDMEMFRKKVPFLKPDQYRILNDLGFGSGKNTEAYIQYKRLYYTYKSGEVIDGTLVPRPFTEDDSDQLIDLLSTFTQLHISEESLKDKKKDLQTETEKKIQILKDRKRKLQENIRFVNEAIGYREKADLIMANMHRIETGMEKITLEDFTTGAPVKIRLKKELSPQLNAERLYRKAKNEGKRLNYLQTSLAQVENEMSAEEDRLAQISEVQTFRDLKSLKRGEKTLSEGSRLPYKTIMIDGFEIRIGKSAKDNDELLSRYCDRTDLWLHAHGVSGSHVIIRTGKGKAVPEHVLLAAASLAALYSKAKHESLAPVVYTERKYVRKPRKAAPGAVLIEREKLIMAEPRSLNE